MLLVDILTAVWSQPSHRAAIQKEMKRREERQVEASLGHSLPRSMDFDFDDLGDGAAYDNGEDDEDLAHYQSVLTANVKRLLQGTTEACLQSKAVFLLEPCMIRNEPFDVVCEWITDNNSRIPPLLALGQKERFHHGEELIRHAKSLSYLVNDDEEHSRLHSGGPRAHVLVPADDVDRWFVRKDFASGELYSLPSKRRGAGWLPPYQASHLILCDNEALLKAKLEGVIPTGLFLINGGPDATRRFCAAVQNSQPVFAFKYTGGCADLVSFMLDEMETVRNTLEEEDKRPISEKRKGARERIPLRPVAIPFPLATLHQQRFSYIKVGSRCRVNNESCELEVTEEVSPEGDVKFVKILRPTNMDPKPLVKTSLPVSALDVRIKLNGRYLYRPGGKGEAVECEVVAIDGAIFIPGDDSRAFMKQAAASSSSPSTSAPTATSESTPKSSQLTGMLGQLGKAVLGAVSAPLTSGSRGGKASTSVSPASDARGAEENALEGGAGSVVKPATETTKPRDDAAAEEVKPGGGKSLELPERSPQAPPAVTVTTTARRRSVAPETSPAAPSEGGGASSNSSSAQNEQQQQQQQQQDGYTLRIKYRTRSGAYREEVLFAVRIQMPVSIPANTKPPATDKDKGPTVSFAPFLSMPRQRGRTLAPTVLAKLNLTGPLSPADLESCRLLNVLANNWPTHFRDNCLQVCDMFEHTVENLQDSITKTMSSVTDPLLEKGGEDRRLSYAWKLRQLFEHNAQIQKVQAEALNFCIILFSLWSTVAAVVYTFLTQSSDSGSVTPVLFSGSVSFAGFTSKTQQTYAYNAILALNIVLPLIITVLRGLLAAFDPALKFTALHQASVKLESEIYLYRTKTGKYSNRKRQLGGPADSSHQQGSGGNNNNKESKSKQGEGKKTNRPSWRSLVGSEEDDSKDRLTKEFSDALETIWSDLAFSDISKGALVVPTENEEKNPLEDANRRIERNRREQRFLSDTFVSAAASDSHIDHLESGGGPAGGRSRWNDDEFDGKDDVRAASRASRVATGIRHAALHATGAALSLTGVTRVKEGMGNLMRKWYREAMHIAESRGRFTSESPCEIFALVTEYMCNKFFFTFCCCCCCKRPSHIDPIDPSEYDDGISSMTAEDYVRKRLFPIVAEYTVRAPNTAIYSNFVTGMTIFLSVLSSVMSTFGLVVWIPVALAMASALGAWSSFQLWDLRLRLTNAALHQLHGVVIWWDSLSLIRKRSQESKNALVMFTETIIQSQNVGFSAKAKKEDEGNTEEEGK